MKRYNLIDVLPSFEVDSFGHIHRNTFFIDSSENLDQGDINDEDSSPGRVKIEIIRRIRETKISKDLKKRYVNRCQICGQSIQMCDRTYAETHHLKPLGAGHNGPDVASNMIVVCPNHHVQLDFGAIGIDPTTRKVITSDGEEIGVLTVMDFHIINKQYLEYHQNNIFNKAKGKKNLHNSIKSLHTIR